MLFLSASFTTGTINPSSRATATPMLKLVLDDDFLVGERGIDGRVIFQRDTAGLHNERHVVRFAPYVSKNSFLISLRNRTSSVMSISFKGRHMRRGLHRLEHMLGDHFPRADQRHAGSPLCLRQRCEHRYRDLDLRRLAACGIGAAGGAPADRQESQVPPVRNRSGGQPCSGRAFFYCPLNIFYCYQSILAGRDDRGRVHAVLTDKHLHFR